MTENIMLIVQLVFYCGAALVVMIYTIIKVVSTIKKAKEGKDISSDLEEISTTISNILTKKFTSSVKKEKIKLSEDTTKYAQKVFKMATNTILSEVQSTGNKNEEITK